MLSSNQRYYHFILLFFSVEPFVWGQLVISPQVLV